MLLETLASTSSALEATSERQQKVALLAELFRAADADVETCVAFMCGHTEQGKLGIGYRLLAEARPPGHAERATLTLREVRDELSGLAELQGKGSKAERGRRLARLLTRATAPEQRFLMALLTGELRQGAQEGLVAEAVALAAGVEPEAVRRALMFAGDLPRVARAALTGGLAGLAEFGLVLFQPLRPMLAQPAQSLEQALAELGQVSLEYKLDGARVQIHKRGDEVRVYSRNSNDVTASVPEVVEFARAVPVPEFVVDGETLALDTGGRPLPFQVTMRRFGRKLGVAEGRQKLPLAVFVFDVLQHAGHDVVDLPYAERLELVDALTPATFAGAWRAVPRVLGANLETAQAFTRQALAAGHEGVMAKELRAAYQAGRRGSAWLKVKPVHTLDLVVLAAEWGSGRRKGWLSNLHLGARDPATGGFVMLGKTFKGLTDELLAFQTRELLAREIGRDGHTVYVRPELVVEIAFDGVQVSPQYPGGLTLRFARVKRYRSDKAAAQADTIQALGELHGTS